MTTGSGREDSTPAFDFARLADISGGDTEFELEILSDYFAQNSTLLSELDRALSTGDVATVRRAAHTLKGSSRTVGAESVAAIAAEIECLAATGTLPGGGGLLARVRHAWAGTQDLLLERFGPDAFRKAG